ncbi:Bax inhibitor-1/YccA family protein [Jatrophihabitans sp.]|uniref:Bax inhibitor-1/YccA family protein n=1 Tax=Jatrophihabitans sp. TaxID=1932789 RepID=UPI0030C65FF9|nr:hypothetical protein [Jatrophihabitans sp.]
MAENPVIKKFGALSGANRGGAPSAQELQGLYDQPAYAGPRGAQRYMTLDDVVQRTAAMLLVLVAAGALSWAFTPIGTSGGMPVVLTSVIAGFGLAMFISFTGKANAVTCLVYSALEGVALGAISRAYSEAYPGIVIQAVTGTVMVAVGMLFVYKIGAIRVTPRFTRIMSAAMFGVIALFLVDVISEIVSPGSVGFGNKGALGVIICLAFIVLAAFMLVWDYDVIERGIRNGADQKFAWYASFGLMVTLVWLYLQILQLLGLSRSN